MERARMVLTIAREGHIWRGRASLVYHLSASMTLNGVALLLPYIIHSHMLGLILEGFLHEELLLVLINIHRWGNTNVISLTLHEAIVIFLTRGCLVEEIDKFLVRFRFALRF